MSFISVSVVCCYFLLLKIVDWRVSFLIRKVFWKQSWIFVVVLTVFIFWKLKIWNKVFHMKQTYSNFFVCFNNCFVSQFFSGRGQEFPFNPIRLKLSICFKVELRVERNIFSAKNTHHHHLVWNLIKKWLLTVNPQTTSFLSQIK